FQVERPLDPCPHCHVQFYCRGQHLDKAQEHLDMCRNLAQRLKKGDLTHDLDQDLPEALRERSDEDCIGMVRTGIIQDLEASIFPVNEAISFLDDIDPQNDEEIHDSDELKAPSKDEPDLVVARDRPSLEEYRTQHFAEFACLYTHFEDSKETYASWLVQSEATTDQLQNLFGRLNVSLPTREAAAKPKLAKRRMKAAMDKKRKKKRATNKDQVPTNEEVPVESVPAHVLGFQTGSVKKTVAQASKSNSAKKAGKPSSKSSTDKTQKSSGTKPVREGIKESPVQSRGPLAASPVRLPIG